MKHNLKISVSKVPQTGGVITCRNVTIRESVLVKLFGNTLFGNHALYRNSIGVI